MRYTMYSDDCSSSTVSDDTINESIPDINSQSCSECARTFISDRYLLSCNGNLWHEDCLRCSVCRISLANESSCYFRRGDVFCKNDYDGRFGISCDKCYQLIHRLDWVRRAGARTYHLACFACDNCKRQLSTGEEFSLADDRLLCKVHSQESLEDSLDRESDAGMDDQTKKKKSRAKRVRTTFSDDQVRVLQANFQIDTNPDGQDLDRIAQITGLSKRVTQVWFQNSRARQKKHRETKTRSITSLEISQDMDTEDSSW